MFSFSFSFCEKLVSVIYNIGNKCRWILLDIINRLVAWNVEYKSCSKGVIFQSTKRVFLCNVPVNWFLTQFYFFFPNYTQYVKHFHQLNCAFCVYRRCSSVIYWIIRITSVGLSLAQFSLHNILWLRTIIIIAYMKKAVE